MSQAPFVYVAFSGIDMSAAVSRDPKNRDANPWFGFLENAKWYRDLDWRGKVAQDVANKVHGIPLKMICTTNIEFDIPGDNWQKAATKAVWKSTCMVVLMGKRTAIANYEYVAWEIGLAMSTEIPVYVMKRRDRGERWAQDPEIQRFLRDVARKNPKHQLKVWPPIKPDRVFTGWDPGTWVYPQMCRFLDANAHPRRPE